MIKWSERVLIIRISCTHTCGSRERIEEMLQKNSDYLPPRRLSLDAEFDARMQHPKVCL